MRIYWMHEAKMLTAVVPDGAVNVQLGAPCPNCTGARITGMEADGYCATMFYACGKGCREAAPAVWYSTSGSTATVEGRVEGQVMESAKGGSTIVHESFHRVSLGPMHGELPEGPERALLTEAAESVDALDLIAKGSAIPVMQLDKEPAGRWAATGRVLDADGLSYVREKMHLRVCVGAQDLHGALLPADSPERLAAMDAVQAEMAAGWQQVGRAMAALHPTAGEFRVQVAAPLKRQPGGQVRIAIADDNDGYVILAGCYYFAINHTK